MPRCPHCGESHGPEFHFCGKTGQPLDLGPRLIGQVLLDRYQVVHLLGEGPVGAVLEVEEERDGSRTRLAAKMLHPRFARDRESVRRFLEDAEKAGRTGHPHIARVLATGRDTGGAPLVVREYMEGESLDRYIAREAPLPVDDAVAIARQILDGLAAAHAVGVANLDLSPGDVFLTKTAGGSLSPKLVDFGEAHLKKAIGREAVTRSAPYFAPEDALGGEPDERADLWATATMLHQMLTGGLPFGDAPDWSASEPPRPTPARKVRDEVEPLLEAVLLKALSADPARRYPDAAAFEAALARAVGARPSLSAPPPRATFSSVPPAPEAGKPAQPETAQPVGPEATQPVEAGQPEATQPVEAAQPEAAQPVEATQPRPAPEPPKGAETAPPAEPPPGGREARRPTPELAAPAVAPRTGTLRLGEALAEARVDEATSPEAATAPTERLEVVRRAPAAPAPAAPALRPRPRPAPAEEDLSDLVGRRPVWPYVAGVGVVVAIVAALFVVPGLMGPEADRSPTLGPVGGGPANAASVPRPEPLVDPPLEPEPAPEPEPAAQDAAAALMADAAPLESEAEPEVEPEPEPAPPRMVRLTIRTIPPGAEISIDGDRAGSSPYESEVEASGRMRLVRIAAAGYQSQTRRLVLDEDRDLEISLSAEPPRSVTAGSGGAASRPGGGAGARPGGTTTGPTKTSGSTRPGGGRPSAGGFQRDNPFD